MDDINSIIKKKNVTQNVNVDNNIYNNVYDDNVAEKINETIDKPKAIAEILTEKLNAPHNLKLYIKLAYQYPVETLFKCLALTKEAEREGRIKKSAAQYFYGIVIRNKRL